MAPLPMIFLLLAAGSLHGQVVPGPSTLQTLPWELQFSDEFEGKAPDTIKWTFRTDSKHWSTQLPQNVSQSNGKLRISLKKENAGGKSYTGGGLISRDTFGFGFYEAKMRTPVGAGWHSSFWLMKHDGSGGTGPGATGIEIDILENDSRVQLGYLTNLHRWRGGHKDVGGWYVPADQLNKDFQTIGCWYRPDSVVYYYNNKRVAARSLAEMPLGSLNIWLTSIASFLGDTKQVDETRLPEMLEFEYVRFFSQAVVPKFQGFPK